LNGGSVAGRRSAARRRFHRERVIAKRIRVALERPAHVEPEGDACVRREHVVAATISDATPPSTTA
jgi:hypothetical protein